MLAPVRTLDPTEIVDLGTLLTARCAELPDTALLARLRELPRGRQRPGTAAGSSPFPGRSGLSGRALATAPSMLAGLYGSLTVISFVARWSGQRWRAPPRQ